MSKAIVQVRRARPGRSGGVPTGVRLLEAASIAHLFLLIPLASMLSGWVTVAYVIAAFVINGPLFLVRLRRRQR